MDAAGKIAIHGNAGVKMSQGPGGGGGGRVESPSFSPSEDGDGEEYGYDGSTESTGSDLAKVEIDSGGNITIKTDTGDITIEASGQITLNGEVHVNGMLFVNGVPVP